MVIRFARILKLPMFYSLFSSGLVTVLGALVIYFGTDKGLAWTAESARRINVLQNNISLPQYYLTNQDGTSTLLYQDSEAESKYGSSLVLMEFIFTRCPTICIAMGAEFSKLQSTLDSIDKEKRVKFISISFDPRDSIANLKEYLSRFDADKERWSSAQFDRPTDLKSIMQLLGAIALPEPDYGFVHNSAVYVLKNNHVIAILDHTDQKELLKIIKQTLLMKANSSENTSLGNLMHEV